LKRRENVSGIQVIEWLNILEILLVAFYLLGWRDGVWVWRLCLRVRGSRNYARCESGEDARAGKLTSGKSTAPPVFLFLFNILVQYILKPVATTESILFQHNLCFIFESPDVSRAVSEPDIHGFSCPYGWLSGFISTRPDLTQNYSGSVQITEGYVGRFWCESH
jgi:hypothetical protein